MSGQFFGDERAAEICRAKGIEIKAHGEGSNSAGGFLVPQEFANGVESNRNESGVLRRQLTLRPMVSDSQQVPLRGDSSAPYFTPENAPTQESDFTFGSAQLKAKKMTVLTRFSSDLVEDYAGMGAYVSQEIGGKFGEAEDDCGFNGDGTAAYGGMLGVAKILADGAHAGGVLAAAGNDTFAELTAADLGTLVGALPEQYLANASFYCSSYALGNTFVRLGATAFGIIETHTGKRPLLQYGGFPIICSGKLAGSGDQSGKMMIGFGDVRASAVLGERRGVTIKASWQRYLDKDQIAFRGTQRFVITWHNVGDASKAGGFVGLLGN